MWLLIPENEAEGCERMRILAGRPYTVGRQNCDFIIANDKSISRCHATLIVTHSETDVPHPYKQPILTIRDESKFGTVIGDEKIVKAQQIVKNGDRVKFGTVSSIYSAVYEPYVVTTSCLDQASKKMTKTVMAKLGGHVVNDWRRECQLLVMSNLSVTVKVICALVSLKSIVTVQYLESMAKAIEAKKDLADPDDFTPPLAESQLNPAEVSFKKDERRKTLLQGKVFIFLDPKQFKKLNLAVELAGGTPMLMEEGTDDNEDDILVMPSSCVMQCDPSYLTQQMSENAQEWIQHVFRVLKKNGKRPIPDCELGYAVLYCSTARYCNPSITASSCQAGALYSQSVSQQLVPPSLVPDENLPTVTPAKKSRPSSSGKTGPAQNGHNSKTVKDQGSAGVKVKVEPLSQEQAQVTLQVDKTTDVPETGSLTSFLNRKRKDEESLPHQPVSKASRTAHQPVKAEPVTLSKAQTAGQSETMATGSSASPRRSPIPPVQSVSVKQGGSQRRGRSRSPSPGPSTKRVSPKRQTHSASNQEMSDDDGEEVDIFDTFKQKSKRRRSPSPGPSHPSTSPDAHVVKQGLNNGVRGQTSTGKGQTLKLKVSKNRHDDEPDETGFAEVRSGAPGPCDDDKRKQQISAASFPKTEILPQALSDDENHSFPQLLAGGGDGPSGFLRAGKPRHGKVETAQMAEGQDDDEDIPADAGMVTVFTSLVSKKSLRPDVPNENNNLVNGNPIKNFKNFRKVRFAGANGLPRIIGGRDLVAHTNVECRDVEDWVNEDRQEESQQNEVDRISEQMFKYMPPSRKKGNRR